MHPMLRTPVAHAELCLLHALNAYVHGYVPPLWCRSGVLRYVAAPVCSGVLRYVAAPVSSGVLRYVAAPVCSGVLR